ncbi:hypothetical protein [Lysobacter capsici]|uniref:hypothetical protein n=1 Tax=Lysobacter capsici TaxID=435897 RepID=UPI00398D1EF5
MLVVGVAAVVFRQRLPAVARRRKTVRSDAAPAVVDKTPIAPAVAAPTPVAPTRAVPAPAAATPAKIVLDDDPADANPFSAGDPPPAHQPDVKPARPAPKLVASATPPKAAAKPAIAPARATTGGKRSSSAKSDDDGLMAALLGNIDTDAQSGGKRTAKPRNANAKEDQDALEQLIRKVNAENAVVAKKAATKPVSKPAPAPKNAAPAKSASPKTSSTTPTNPVQASLRKCPKANTTKGLQCRQKVCAKYAGQDPACPV